MEYYLNKKITDLHYSAIEYYCPAQVIEGLIAELKGKKYKYHEEGNWFNAGHFFWFIITSGGECGIISGMNFNVWHLKNVYENNYNPPNDHPKLPKKYEKLFKEFIQCQLKEESSAI